MKKQKVAIIITTYSQDKLLEKNIKSIKNKTSGKNYKIYLIDDASKNKIGGKIKNKFPFMEVIINKTNKGFSKSNNLGIKKAIKEYNPDWFLIYNDDCEIIEESWLNKFVDITKNFPNAGIFGCKLIYPDGSFQWGAKKNKNYFFKEKGIKEIKNEFSKTQETTEIIGACMLIKKAVINKLKGFDENFSPFYGEESDLCFRTKKEGYKIIYVGNLKLIHHGSKSISKIPKEKVWFIKKRNSIRLEWLNFSFPKIIKYSFIHLGSIFDLKEIRQSPIKFILLIKAFIYNLKRFKEIKNKRKERNGWSKK